MNVSRPTTGGTNDALPLSRGELKGGWDHCGRLTAPHPHPGPPLEGEGDRAWLTFIASQECHWPRRRPVDDQVMAAVTPRIRTEHPVLPMERFRQRVPDGMTRGPAMQENQRGTFASDAHLESFAVIGNESLHEKSVAPYSIVSAAAVKCRPADRKSQCIAFIAKPDRTLVRLRDIRGRASMSGSGCEASRSGGGETRHGKSGRLGAGRLA
jgi:hypothetical protein